MPKLVSAAGRSVGPRDASARPRALPAYRSCVVCLFVLSFSVCVVSMSFRVRMIISSSSSICIVVITIIMTIMISTNITLIMMMMILFTGASGV